MTNDPRTTDEIERNIANERAQMSDALNDLQNKFSINTVVNDIGDMIRDQGGELGQKVGQTVRRNPTAVAPFTVGAAWLILGPDRSNPATETDRQPRQTFGRCDEGPGSAQHGSHAWPHNRRNTASDLTSFLSRGLKDLSEAAKSRVMSARRAAHEAKRTSREGTRRATNFFEEQPIVAGAHSIAVGAAFGAMLPHSKFEDNAMGESRDQLFAEAETLLREERDRVKATARKVGKSLASDVWSDVEDMGSTFGGLLPEGKSARDVITDHVSGTAERLLANASGRSQQKDVNCNDI